MDRQSTRRGLLATLPALAAATAGCSAFGGGGEAEPSPEGEPTATETNGGGSGTDSSTTPVPLDVQPWQFHANDAASTGRIDGTVPTTGLTEHWSQTADLLTDTIIFPVFNAEATLLAFRLKKQLLVVDHAGEILAKPRVEAPWQKFAQSDGFLVESRGDQRQIVRFDNAGERVFTRAVPRRIEFEPHPEQDVLSYTMTREPADGPTVERVGVYDLAAEASRWENSYPVERPPEDDGPTSYRLRNLYVDGDALVFSILPDENTEDGVSTGAMVCLDRSTGEERWRLDGVSRTVCNLSDGQVLSAGVSWTGDSDNAVNQYLRSYHLTDLESGKDRTVADISTHDALFTDSKLGFDEAFHYLVDGRVYATDPARETLVALHADGTRAWTYEPAGTVECRPRSAENALVLGTSQGVEFVGFDGTRAGRFDLETSFEGGIMLTPGRVYACGQAIHAIGRAE